MNTDYTSFGVGISDKDYLGSARNGMMNPNQAYMMFANGEAKTPDVIRDRGREEFDSEKPEPKQVKPILTRNGKLAFVILVLGVTAYALYKRHKANQDAGTNEVVTSDTEGQTNTENTGEATADKGGVPEASTAESGATQPDSTAPTTLESTANIAT